MSIKKQNKTKNHLTQPALRSTVIMEHASQVGASDPPGVIEKAGQADMASDEIDADKLRGLGSHMRKFETGAAGFCRQLQME